MSNGLMDDKESHGFQDSEKRNCIFLTRGQTGGQQVRTSKTDNRNGIQKGFRVPFSSDVWAGPYVTITCYSLAQHSV